MNKKVNNNFVSNNFILAKHLWSMLGDTPVNDNDEIDTPFLMFDTGTDKLAIWHWFEDTFNISVTKLY